MYLITLGLMNAGNSQRDHVQWARQACLGGPTNRWACLGFSLASLSSFLQGGNYQKPAHLFSGSQYVTINSSFEGEVVIHVFICAFCGSHYSILNPYFEFFVHKIVGLHVNLTEIYALLPLFYVLCSTNPSCMSIESHP